MRSLIYVCKPINLRHDHTMRPFHCTLHAKFCANQVIPRGQNTRKLILDENLPNSPDFSTKPWCNAILVTPRHSVRELWNEAAVKKHSQGSGNRRYIVHAEDTLRDASGPIPLEVRVKIAAMPEKSTSRLREIVDLAIGMKTMVLNLSTEADIANGTRGTITDIVLDPREQLASPNEDGSITLRFPPVLVLFRPDSGTDIRFEGLPAGVVPISPSTCSFNIQIGKQTHKIWRRQQQ